MGRTISRINLAAIFIAVIALITGLAYMISQPISAQGAPENIETRLQAAVSSGKITQAAANERLKAFARISEDGSTKNSHYRESPKVTAENLEARLQEAVEAGKLTQNEANQKLEAFNSRANKDCETEKSNKRPQPKDIEDRIQRGIKSGAITQGEGDALRKRLFQVENRRAA